MCRKGWETKEIERYGNERNLILVDYNGLMVPDSMFASFLRIQY